MNFTQKMLATALLALGLGTAQAQTSVTLYGIVDAGVQGASISAPNYSSSNYGMANGTQSGNRFGFKGSEDLGSGLRATFDLEAGFNLGSGVSGQSGALFGRQAWIGLENSNWGYVRAGKQYNFATDYVGAIDPFFQGFGQANIGTTFGTANTTRYNNMLKYQTPTFSGLTGGIGYSFANGMTNVYADPTNPTVVAANTSNFATNNNGRVLTLGGQYVNGPLTAVASYDVMYGASNVTLSNYSNPTQWILGGMYDLSVAKVSLAYSQTRNGWFNGQAAADSTFSAGTYGNAVGGVLLDPNFGANSYMVGTTVPLSGTQKLFASFQYAQPVSSMANTANLSIYSAGYQYDLSKRTNLYGYISQANNYAFIQDAQSTVYGLGMRHSF